MCPRVCAVAGGGVPSTQAGQGAGRASDPGSPESDGRTAGGYTRENPGRPRSAPTRREAARRPRRPLIPIACPQRPRSVQPSTKARQCRLCTPRTCHRCHTKQNLLTFFFSDSSENPAPGTLSPVFFIQVACAFRRRVFPQLLIDLEVGTFRFGGMINHQQLGHGLGSAVEAAIFALCSESGTSQSSLKSPFF